MILSSERERKRSHFISFLGKCLTNINGLLMQVVRMYLCRKPPQCACMCGCKSNNRYLAMPNYYSIFEYSVSQNYFSSMHQMNKKPLHLSQRATQSSCAFSLLLLLLSHEICMYLWKRSIIITINDYAYSVFSIQLIFVPIAEQMGLGGT